MTKADITAALDGQKGQDILLNAPEICVWMTVFGCLQTLREIQESFAAEKVNRKDYYRQCSEALIGLADTADATHRFGVLLPSSIEPNFRRRLRHLDGGFIRVNFSSSFWRWYNWWDDYVKTKTTAEAKHIYHLAMERVPAVDDFRPAGDWVVYRSEPALVLSSI